MPRWLPVARRVARAVIFVSSCGSRSKTLPPRRGPLRFCRAPAGTSLLRDSLIQQTSTFCKSTPLGSPSVFFHIFAAKNRVSKNRAPKAYFLTSRFRTRASAKRTFCAPQRYRGCLI
eukprot:9504187-Pyramimonas_sp.AAC.5